MLHWLHQSHHQFLASIHGVNEAQWVWKPSPDRWSVSEVAEHVVLSEAILFAAVQRALALPANPDWEAQTKGKTEFIERVMAPRLGKARAPESIAPKGGLTREEVRETFERQRVEIEKFSALSGLPLHEHTLDHPFPAFGTLSAYQWFLYIPLHTLRHDRQIAEIKTSPQFPQ